MRAVGFNGESRREIKKKDRRSGRTRVTSRDAGRVKEEAEAVISVKSGEAPCHIISPCCSYKVQCVCVAL